MTNTTAEQPATEKLIAGIVDHMSRDPLCIEIRHYPALFEPANGETLHLLIIMERELSQPERQRYLEALNSVAAQYGMRVAAIFSSPRVWRDLRALVSPFARVEQASILDWQRED